MDGVLPHSLHRILAKLWLGLLMISSLLILFALEIAIFGVVPGESNPDMILIIMLSALGAGLVILLLTFVAGFA